MNALVAVVLSLVAVLILLIIARLVIGAIDAVRSATAEIGDGCPCLSRLDRLDGLRCLHSKAVASRPAGKLIVIAGATRWRGRELWEQRLSSIPPEEVASVRRAAGLESIYLRNGDRIIPAGLRNLNSIRGLSIDVIEVEDELTKEQQAAIYPCFAVTGGRVVMVHPEPTEEMEPAHG